MIPEQKATIRKQLLQLRSSLPLSTRQQAEGELITHLLVNDKWQQATNIASYAAMKGEVDLTYLHQQAWQQQKHLFLPVLMHTQLRFAPYTLDSKFRSNQYNIIEPCVAEEEYKTAAQLDLLLIPLVGFDAQGNRLGMGKGYFDLTLAPLMNLPKRPFLMGVAFACQQVPQLPIDEWDIPLDAIVTEQGVLQVIRSPH
jgi:5-formyltetrahydrofolate cyclo-ligase